MVEAHASDELRETLQGEVVNMGPCQPRRHTMIRYAVQALPTLGVQPGHAVKERKKKERRRLTIDLTCTAPCYCPRGNLRRGKVVLVGGGVY